MTISGIHGGNAGTSLGGSDGPDLSIHEEGMLL